MQTDREGIVVKADTLGSLEALTNLLKQSSIKIKKASIGNITKKMIELVSSDPEHVSYGKI